MHNYNCRTPAAQLPLVVVARISALIFAFGCAEKIEPPKPEAEQPTAFAFTNTDETVVADRIDIENKKSVVADFNLDGLDDLAALSEMDNGVNEVAIYIQKQTSPSEPAGAKKTYYKAATIKRVTEGKIIGIASRRQKNLTDLIVLVSHANQNNEMIHYQNDGMQFIQMP